MLSDAAFWALHVAVPRSRVVAGKWVVSCLSRRTVDTFLRELDLHHGAAGHINERFLWAVVERHLTRRRAAQ